MQKERSHNQEYADPIVSYGCASVNLRQVHKRASTFLSGEISMICFQFKPLVLPILDRNDSIFDFHIFQLVGSTWLDF